MTGVIWYERTLNPCTSRNIREGTEVATLRTEQPKLTTAIPMANTINSVFLIILIVPSVCMPLTVENCDFSLQSTFADELAKNI